MSGRLYYQPIGIPNGSSGAAAVASAANAIGEGIGSIGAGLTRLGARRQARLEAENEKQRSAALESIGLLAQNAGSQEELDALTSALLSRSGGGALPAGASALLGARESDILTNTGLRLDNEGQSGRNVAQLIKNESAQGTLDDQNMIRAFTEDFGSEINEAARLYSLGDMSGARAIEEDILSRAGSKYGANPSAILGSNLDLLSKGDDTRFGIQDNALTLRGTRQNQAIQAEEAADADRARDTAYADNRVDRRRSDELFGRNEQIDVATSNAMLGAIDKDQVLRRVQAAELDPRVKTQILDNVENLFEADPNILDKYNTLDPFAKTDRNFTKEEQAAAALNSTLESIGLPGVLNVQNNSDLDPSTTVASILDTTDRLFQTSPSLSVWNDAQNIREEVGSSSIPDMGKYLQERYQGIALPDKWKNRIEATQRRHNLTDTEVVALADRSLKARGANFLGVNLIPGNERADEQILDVDEFDRLAADYDKNNTGNLAAQGQGLRDFAGRARELESSIPRLIDARQRAIQSNNTQEKNRIEKQIVDAQNELAGLERSLSGMLPGERGEAQNIFDTINNIQTTLKVAPTVAGARLRR